MNVSEYIQPWSVNPQYWQCKGKAILPLGGSVEDNLFQIQDLEAHLDLLLTSGGNYVRNTLSARDEGNRQPHLLNTDGTYDLEQWDPQYWQQLETFLKLTYERDIIVQFEMWDRFDFSREFWQQNSFNPRLNCNYSAEESQLAEEIDSHPGENESRWFFSVPALDNNTLILEHQHRYIDKVLSYSLQYPHILYCMDNETQAAPEWGQYWSAYIKAQALKRNVPVQTTEMWDAWDLANEEHQRTWKHPEIYSFCDVSQNNHQKGEDHWSNLQDFIKDLAPPRPVNTVKTYGADGGRFGSTIDGQERFWRSIFGGCATARFHRPDSGLGLGAKAQANIKSLRMVTDCLDWFNGFPCNDLLSERPLNGSYCFGSPDGYAVYFPHGEAVTLDLSATGLKQARWLHISSSQWKDEEPAVGRYRLTPPCHEPWAVVLT